MKKILVHHYRHETTVAIIKDGELTNYYCERDDNPQLVGNIYKGKIQNFLPGMQAAFVDIGRDKNAFLQLNKKQQFQIGQDVVIQIKKEAIGTKGPRATREISIPSHNLVLMPYSHFIGVSQKIDNNSRKRLYKIAQNICPDNTGLLLRTASEECDEESLANETQNLFKYWKSLEKTIPKKKSPSLLYSDNDLMTRIVRDECTSDVELFLIDSLKITNRVRRIVKDIAPNLITIVKRYTSDVPIFDKFHITDEIKKINQREVELPSGGFIVIDKTEALTAIDVNTGKFVGSKNLADTAYQTNLEAAAMIMRQLRLRNIGGIIIVDFIDMHDDEKNKTLMTHLRQEAKMDRLKTKIIDMTPLGLVEITRKRLR